MMKRVIALEKIDDIKKQLIEKYKPEKIILFGSSAWGVEDINDIDLFIIKSDVPHYGADRIIELYRLMDVDAAVDFIVYKPEEAKERLALGDPFIKKIYKDGKVLYG
jgi:predicted nucleotidyltransferase